MRASCDRPWPLPRRPGWSCRTARPSRARRATGQYASRALRTRASDSRRQRPARMGSWPCSRRAGWRCRPGPLRVSGNGDVRSAGSLLQEALNRRAAERRASSALPAARRLRASSSLFCPHGGNFSPDGTPEACTVTSRFPYPSHSKPDPGVLMFAIRRLFLAATVALALPVLAVGCRSSQGGGPIR